MLEEINSPLADTNLESEDDISAYSEAERGTEECEIPYSLKNDRKAFRAALRYLCAYSFRMPELNEDYVNFVDTIIDCITEMTVSTRNNGKRVFHYYEIINNLNEIIENISI